MHSNSKVHHHEEQLFFFGENYRECCGLLHIVTACKLILLVEVAKIVAEFFLITYRFGSVDAVTVVHYTATVTAMLCVLVGLLKERYILFWPFLVLKALETILCLIAAIGIMLLVLVGSAGRRLLVRAVRWRYRSMQDSHAIGVAFLFFFLFVFLFLLNALIVKVVHRAQHYVRKKTMTQYLLARRDVLHSIMRC
ncbi:hypothetical protein QR680_018406 [Steinernema hermaphroditum]|uniref:Uncharacterized protein n=1 Tax=Steinernema hermaphroditum TaxID=289476 RepID=A0AA39HJZ5_9BILA|nr:hypothetical protein QR680_018406 [Steinernema hermaphroditum]